MLWNIRLIINIYNEIVNNNVSKGTSEIRNNCTMTFDNVQFKHISNWYTGN